ncbi:YcjF family protein [Aliivibrio kagoshimensis]|uniref:YcjF family protein n=1 Tax=Aliivibrio kagoshimensis TaxID=2910230 RepID=UPI003D0F0317
MSELKKKKVFSEQAIESEYLEEEQPKEALNPQRLFDEKEVFLPKESVAEPESDAEKSLSEALAATSKKSSKGIKTLIGGFIGLTAWQSIDQVYQAWVTQDWLALGWSGLLVLVASLGISALGREWLILRKLKNRMTEQQVASQLIEANGIGKGRQFCTALANSSNITSENSGYDSWLNALAATHNDAEVLQLYDNMVVSQQDKQAKKLVSKYASEAALMVAVSPLAVVDMLLVAWRSFTLVEKVSRIYGVELGYFSRIKLFKLVITNMAIVGASEVVADVGMDVLSMDLTARLSTRAAQGVGVGLLTARLGLKAMALMRPLPWREGDAPKLSELRKNLLLQLGPKKE